jgi:hypothetical protein
MITSSRHLRYSHVYRAYLRGSVWFLRPSVILSDIAEVIAAVAEAGASPTVNPTVSITVS